MQTEALFATEQIYELPPLILHPFSDASGPNTLIESSRASLILQGLLPAGQQSSDELERKLLEGRYCEVRMLFYVGRDLRRWLEQCMDVVSRSEEMKASGVCELSFAEMLVDHPPEDVREKLVRWGVADYKAIFSRALGLNAIFENVPERGLLAADFIRNYYRYADWLFASYLKSAEHAKVNPEQFSFQLFASGEYSRMLEQEWGS
jgi:hypothetical protein